MVELLRQGWKPAVMIGMVALLAACASGSRKPAPVEDRTPGGAAVVQPAAAQDPSRPPLPGLENAGKPGYYTVRPGDTLIRIALESGQNWRDLVRWNNLDNPNVIEVGQVVRVIPPVAGTPAPAVVAGTPEGVVTRPVTPGAVTPGALPPAGAASAPARATVTAAAPASPAAAAPPVVAGDDDVPWGWPAPGNTSVLAGFDEVKNKGLDIAGKAGDPVLASADGRVVYAGAGLRGYGNLIILKHNNTYLTAYAHNQALLVKEDQPVRKGQKIAEMGASDAERVKLHFEIRRQGKPVDPSRYLPAR